MPPFVAFSGPLALVGRDRRALLERGRRELMEARVQVMPLGHDVRDNGDDALFRLARRFDGVELESLRISSWDWKRRVAQTSKADRAALEAAARRIRAYHARQVPEAYEVSLDGVRLGWKPVALDRVGVYVPGGKAAYPSSVLMGAIPAKLAGVKEVVVCTPPREDRLVPAILLAACEVAGVEEVYMVGGAQAVFAMAYGTPTIPRVQKVVGPGNVFVQAAKQLVHGFVGTDALAGPSEVLVLADDSAPADLIAWELAAQAEHDVNASCVLVCTSEDLRAEVEAELRALVPTLPRAETIAHSLSKRGALLVAKDLAEAVAFANEFAAEHLVIMTEDPRAVLGKVRAAGSVFLGPHSPVALGDYGAGTNHILPTAAGAQFSSGLSVLDFVRFIQWQEASPAGLAKVGPTVQHLADLEGLQAHGGAVGARLKARKRATKTRGRPNR
jgi:histidinol dehydrogenase